MATGILSTTFDVDELEGIHLKTSEQVVCVNPTAIRSFVYALPKNGTVGIHITGDGKLLLANRDPMHVCFQQLSLSLPAISLLYCVQGAKPFSITVASLRKVLSFPVDDANYLIIDKNNSGVVGIHIYRSGHKTVCLEQGGPADNLPVLKQYLPHTLDKAWAAKINKLVGKKDVFQVSDYFPDETLKEPVFLLGHYLKKILTVISASNEDSFKYGYGAIAGSFLMSTDTYKCALLRLLKD